MVEKQRNFKDKVTAFSLMPKSARIKDGYISFEKYIMGN